MPSSDCPSPAVLYCSEPSLGLGIYHLKGVTSATLALDSATQARQSGCDLAFSRFIHGFRDESTPML
jgi:hypothetical protein